MKLIFEMILKVGGPLDHNFVSINLLGLILNTTLKVFRKTTFYFRGFIDTLGHRVYLASFVCHMMYFGREYVLHRDHGHSLAENWFTKQSEQDLLIYSHFVFFIHYNDA